LDCNTQESFFHYAYVDPRNVRSNALCKEFGFQVVRQYATVLFNRINPEQTKKYSVAEITPEEQKQVREKLIEFYRDYTMFSFENLFGDRKYFVVKDANGNILAGAQANPDQWKVLSFPGWSGNLILHCFSMLPLLRKILNKNYRFVTLEGLFCVRGAEKHLEALCETLLRKFNVNTAIMVVDADSEIYRILKSLNLGLVEKLNKEVRGNVICRFVNFNEDQKKSFEVIPAYISGIDVT